MNMSKFAWNKKALAGIAAVTLLASMSPISAVAEDMGPSSVTYTVDMNEGGGGGVVCPTQTTFTVDPGAAQPTSLGVTEAASTDDNSQDLYYDSNGIQYTDSYNSLDPSTPFTQDDFNEWERNKKHSFAFTPMVIAFDADGCETSTLAAVVIPSRGPVLRAATSADEFEVAEIRNDESPDQDGYGTANNVGMANLFANSDSMMGGGLNFNSPYWEHPLWETADSILANDAAGDQWPIAGGSDGEFTLQPRIDIFGQNPSGVYKVTYHLMLEVYDDGLDSNNCWWFCY
jgi:hypothetical protein